MKIDCNFSSGNHCTYAYAYFSVNGSHYALYCAGPDPVFVTIMNANHRQIFTWEENRSLRRKLAGRARPILKNLNVNANGYTSKVKLYLPPDFDEKKRYPLLINV